MTEARSNHLACPCTNTNYKYSGSVPPFIMPRCTVHRRHTVVRSCVGLSVPRFLGMSDFAYLRER